MCAATFTDYGEPLSVEDTEEPTVDPDGVIVEMEACGVCRSDWHAWQGHWSRDHEPGHVFGHEPAGTVVKVGAEVERIAEGDHVTVPFHTSDGTCHRCWIGQSNLYENGVEVGLVTGVQGGFAERMPVPNADENVVSLPDGISSVDMAGLGCRFMTSFHALSHRADVDGGDWLAVHGCGGVGLSAVDVGTALGANVIAVDLDDKKLDTAEELGAAETVNAANTENVSGAVHALTDGGAHVSVDALGIAETCRNSVGSLRPRGQHVQVGLTSADEGGEVPVPTDEIVMKELSVVGSHGMPAPDHTEIFRMLEAGRIDPGAVVSAVITLDDVADTLDAVTDYDTSGIPMIGEF